MVSSMVGTVPPTRSKNVFLPYESLPYGATRISFPLFLQKSNFHIMASPQDTIWNTPTSII